MGGVPINFGKFELYRSTVNFDTGRSLRLPVTPLANARLSIRSIADVRTKAILSEQRVCRVRIDSRIEFRVEFQLEFCQTFARLSQDR